MQPNYVQQYYPRQYAASRVSACQVPVPPSRTVTSTALQAGVFGMVVVSSGTLGANLHHVSDGHMTLGQAVGHAAACGVTGGVAAASATAASATLTRGGVAGVAVTLAAATGVSYLINKLMK